MEDYRAKPATNQIEPSMKLERRPSIETTAQTPLGRLRALLDHAERLAVSVGTSADDAVLFLTACDAIEQLLEDVSASADVRPEANRTDFLRGRLRANATSIVRIVQRAGRHEMLRDSHSWYVALTTAERERSRRTRRLALIGAVLVLIVAALAALPILFPAAPAPDLTTISRLISAGDMAAALEQARVEHAAYPDNAEATLWLGVLELRAGDSSVAAALFQQAQQQYGNDIVFLFERGNVLTQVGLFDAAAADARTLIARSDAQAEGYLLLGGVQEARGDRDGAIVAFERAAEQAAATGKTQLEVVARARLGILLQAPPVFPTPTPP